MQDELQSIADAIKEGSCDVYENSSTADHLYNINYNTQRIADAIEKLITVINQKKS